MHLKFNFIRDIRPVAGINREPFAIEVNPSVPVKTVPEFIAYAKANPGKINMASGGIGSGNHIFGELFKMMTGVKLVHVPYRGAGPALVDLLGGQVQVMFASISSSIEYVRADKLRALAGTTSTRSPVLPDIPPMAEFVPGYEASFWTGIGAPKNTPAEIVDKLNKEINAALSDPKFEGRLPTWAAPHFPVLPLISVSLSPTKPRNGARWCGLPTSSRSDSCCCSVNSVLRMVPMALSAAATEPSTDRRQDRTFVRASGRNRRSGARLPSVPHFQRLCAVRRRIFVIAITPRASTIGPTSRSSNGHRNAVNMHDLNDGQVFCLQMIFGRTDLTQRQSLRLLGLETHFPCTTETAECPLEHILNEIAREMLEPNRCSKCAILPNSSVYLLRPALERGTAGHSLSKNG